jgi:hypothetical protein
VKHSLIRAPRGGPASPDSSGGPTAEAGGLALHGSARRSGFAAWASGRRGKNGKVRRSLGFGHVRSLGRETLQSAGLSERARTRANGRSHLPCRRSWVRVPSSAPHKAPGKRGFFVGRKASRRDAFGPLVSL